MKFHFANTPEGTPNDFLHQILMIRNGLKLQFRPTGKCRVLAILFSEMLHIRFAPIRLLFPANTTRLARIAKHLPCRQIGKSKRIFLRMEKTASASFVWINGQEVGYNEGAQEPAEYDVTSFLKPGKIPLPST